MSRRTIGGQTTWGSKGEAWAFTDPTLGPLAGDPDGTGTTWAATADVSDIEARLSENPSSACGAPIAPHASGALRFIVQLLDPTAGADSVWGTALWGSSAWSSSVGAWRDVSSRVRGATWTNGTTSPDGKATVGTATVTLDNRDGAVSAWATSGDFVGTGSSSWVRTGLLVRFGVIKVSALAVGLPALDDFSAFFTGKVEVPNEGTSENVDAWVDLELTETTADFAVDGGSQNVNADRALSATIFDAITASGWPYQTSLMVPAEDTTVPSTALIGGTSSSRLDLLVDGLYWDWLADGRGRIIIVRRRLPESDAGLTFANAPAGSDVPVVEITTTSGVDNILNQVNAARINGPIITVEDDRSMLQFGTVTQRYGFPRDDLVLESDAEVTTLARRVLGLRAWDDLGVATIALDMDLDPVRLPAILTYLACRAREAVSFNVTYTHPSGAVLADAFVVEGQTHNLAPVGEPGTQLKWTCTLNVGHAGITSES